MRIASLWFLLAFIITPAWANPVQWQEQLQKDIGLIQSSSANIAVDGQVQVSQESNGWRAQLPVMLLTQSDGTMWHIPAIIMTRQTGGQDVSITLPSAIALKDAAGKTVGLTTIGQQSLTGTWSDASGFFQSLHGQLKQVKIRRDHDAMQGAIDQVEISSQSAHSLMARLKDIQGSSGKNGKSNRFSIGSVESTYDFKGAAGFGIEQMLGMLQQNYLTLSKKPVAMTMQAQNIVYQNGDNVTSRVDAVKTQALVTPKADGKTADVQNHIDLIGMARSPAKVGDVFLPKSFQMTGVVTNLPLSLLGPDSPGNHEAAKEQMAAAKTRINFDTIRLKTAEGATMTGNGQLAATASVPTGFTGRVNFKTENLATIMTGLQQKMKAPGADIATQGQAMMMYMMLQGFGTQNNQATQYVLDMTPDGQVLLNGKDISGLVKLGLGGMNGGMNSLLSVPTLGEAAPIRQAPLAPLGELGKNSGI